MDRQDCGVTSCREREKLPPISSVPARGSKPPLPSLGTLVDTLNQRRGRVRDADTPATPPGLKHVRDLPPIGGGPARPKQRASIDTLPPTVKAPFPCEPVIPLRTKTAKDFLEEAEHAALSGDWREVRDFYLTTFDSFIELNAAFKREANAPFDTIDDSGVDGEFVNAVYDALVQTPADIQKSVLKGIINSLLREWKGPRTKDDLRAYFILVQNPQYSSTGTYVIYAHLLRQMAALSEADHHFLAHWLKKLSSRRFRQPVERLLQFISARLFPAEPDELPPASKCAWWIPSATKVLALFNAANSVSSPPIMPFSDFYNIALEHIDFMDEYRIWQSYGNSSRSEDSRYPSFLAFCVPWHHSVCVCVRDVQLSRKRCDLKKKLRVTFVGEAGLDMGGLTKEWFLLLVRQIFHADYGMFTYTESRCHWFSSWKCDNNYSEFQLIGTVMGLAVYNSIALDIHFPLYCYRKLLTPPTAPCDQDASVGTATATLDDLRQIMPELAHGLDELLNFDGNVEEDLCLTFQVWQEEMGAVKSYNLRPGGDKIPVTKQNRKEYVQLYVDFLLNKSIHKQFAAFYHGFHSVCASDALMLLRPEEVEMLVCGSPQLDMSALQKAAHYEGYSKSDATIRSFWEVVLSFPMDLQKKLLHFATGSDRVPVGGMADLNFKISKIDAPTDWLPVSHTCFNQICLPPYRSRKELKHKLTIAISNAEGFGLQ
ncbi:probable E3 ubiquitin-protein ligase HECTD2 [Phyllopteryx taeniolatus]|uniref:probable E3 ubiquitin-protein ligase HECTD2 n=1 Tax=Phyllopteryx taeniolatus TaxID=161469 RepID=UPI002AD2192B|nr:probable E3 ubiquitin-protein ligase HECTD2 [Phyllopteryx taeniolatus]